MSEAICGTDKGEVCARISLRSSGLRLLLINMEHNLSQEKKPAEKRGGSRRVARMSGAPLDVLGSRLAQGVPRYPGIHPHVAIGVRLRRDPCWLIPATRLSHAEKPSEQRGAWADRLITMPWDVDVAQRGTHYLR
jgi:hypothetical protein